MNHADQIKKALEELPKSVSEYIAAISESVAKKEVSELREKLHHFFELSEFLDALFGKAEVVALGERTSFREDSVLRDACLELTGTTTTEISLLDVGCGVGNVAYALLQGLTSGALRRIRYSGVDRNLDLVRDLTALKTEARAIYKTESTVRTLNDFASFEVYQGDVLSLPALATAPFDLVVCHNLCHEIPPFRIPHLLQTLNQVLRRDDVVGKLAVVDMEGLPIEFPEAEAFTWTAEEFGELLQAAGFPNHAVSRHVKKVPVFSATVRRIETVNVTAAIECVTRIVVRRLAQRLSEFRRIRVAAGRGEVDIRRLMQVLVEVGFIMECLKQHKVAIHWSDT